MSKFDGDECGLELETFPNAPCHTCIYRDRGDVGNMTGGAKTCCEKYPEPRYSIGINGKPSSILEGTKPCKYYKQKE